MLGGTVIGTWGSDTRSFSQPPPSSAAPLTGAAWPGRGVETGHSEFLPTTIVFVGQEKQNVPLILVH